MAFVVMYHVEQCAMTQIVPNLSQKITLNQICAPFFFIKLVIFVRKFKVLVECHTKTHNFCFYPDRNYSALM